LKERVFGDILKAGCENMLERGASLLADAVEKVMEAARCSFGGGWLAVISAGGCDGIGPVTMPDGAEGASFESHGFAELCVCLEGEFILATAGGSGFEAQPGRAFLLLPGASHTEVSGRSYRAAWFSIDCSRVVGHVSGRQDRARVAVADVAVLKTGLDPMRVVDEICSEITGKGTFYMDSIKASVLRLLALIRRGLETAGPGDAFLSNWRETIAGEIAGYIKSNLDTRIRLTDAAQTVCVSPAHLNLIFKEQTGRTIMRYHEECRMDAARKMLLGSNASVGEVASAFGFYDQYHFSKAFKKEYGASPAAYRKEAENASDT
jgi:AraC-like DNA-binding protein